MVQKKRNKFLIGDDKTIEIVCQIKMPDGDYSFSYVFQEPTAEDKKKWYEHESSTLNLKLAASEALFDNCCLGIGGDYQLKEEANWKTAVPIEHKHMAINRLLSRYGILTPEEQKN